MEDKIKEKQLIIVNYQLLTTIFLLIPSLLSITILYNDKLKLENKKPLFTEKEEKQLILLNRYLTLFATIIFLYLAYETYIIATTTKDQKKIDLAFLNLFSSLLITISSLILLYIVENQDDITIPTTEITI